MATVASLSVLAQAAIVAHALLVPHTTCLEHGTVAHESRHAHADPSRALEAPAPSSPSSWVRGDDTHTHTLALEDEHCSLLGTHHLPAPQIFGAELKDRRVPAAAEPIERPAAISTLAQYRLAPKASPPQA